MTGRGVDQILPSPNSPALHESYICDARDYVLLAERAHGAISRPVEFGYVWGDALAELESAGVDLRIVNLETSITTSEAYWRGKGIHYRMHPGNVGCLTAARIDCCCLANNHVLDWGHEGLLETLQALDAAGIAHAGAGRDAEEAAAPAVLEVHRKGRVLVFAYGSVDSGIPWEWEATGQRPGVRILADLSEATAERITGEMQDYQCSGDVLVASIHWGGNLGYSIPEEQRRFAHRLVERGVAVVHGHSSHHVKAVERYRDGLVLYGCGDFLNDYEGIGGYEEYRGDLALMYLVSVESKQGRVIDLRLVPMRMERFRLNHASEEDAQFLEESAAWAVDVGVR